MTTAPPKPRLLVDADVLFAQPDIPSITVLRPGEFVVRVRHLLANLTSGRGE